MRTVIDQTPWRHRFTVDDVDRRAWVAPSGHDEEHELDCRRRAYLSNTGISIPVGGDGRMWVDRDMAAAVEACCVAYVTIVLDNMARQMFAVFRLIGEFADDGEGETKE